MTTNPFTARLTAAAKEGYVGTGAPGRVGGRIYTTHRPAAAPARAELAIEAPSSERQRAWAYTLLGERLLTDPAQPKWETRVRQIAASWDTELPKLTRTQASALIDYLLTLPMRERTPEVATQAEVPAGRYAVEIDGTVRFYAVDRPETGRWAGWTFVERQVSDDFMRISKGEQARALEAIREAGFAEASKLYGRELGVCGVCGRTLTNEESRAAGIGPKCASNSGW
jgi:hypothetical protein